MRHPKLRNYIPGEEEIGQPEFGNILIALYIWENLGVL